METQKKTEINPAMKNMLFSMIEAETFESAKMNKLDITRFGRLSEIMIILSPEKEVQQIKWTKKPYTPKTDEVKIEPEQKVSFCMLFSADPEKLYDDCKNILVKLDFLKQTIFFTKNKLDGTVQNETI